MINLELDRDTMRMMMDHLDKVECEELTGTVWRVLVQVLNRMKIFEQVFTD